MFRHDGELHIVLAIASSDSNTSIEIVLQMTKVVTVFLVLQPSFFIGKVFLQDQLILTTIRKSDGNFRDVIKGSILPNGNCG